MQKNAFVTGATGFLGVHLIEALVKDGWNITAIHRSKIEHPLLKNATVSWKEASLFDVESLKKALPDDDFTVFHLAASTAQWQPEFAMQRKTNVLGTANVIEAALYKKARRFVHTSSITSFGLHEGIITEKTPQTAKESNLEYAITKLEGEELVKKAVREQNLDAVILNPCHIIGPWDTHNWIQLFEKVLDKSLPGIPPASGNFAWVSEVAKAHITAASLGKKGENYILGGPYATMLAMIQEMQQQLSYPISSKTTPAFLLRAMVPVFTIQSFFTKKEPTLTPNKVTFLLKSLQADDAKAKLELGYKHKTMPEIVKETLAWVKNR